MNPNSLRGKAAPVTTLCGQLAALKTQPFCVKAEREEKKVKTKTGGRVSLSQEQSSKHGAFAQREDTCVLPNFLARMGPITAGAIFGTATVTASLSQTGNCKVSRKIRCERGIERGEKVISMVPR